MSKIIIGCDPDSDKHGIAFYVDGKLDKLQCLNLPDFLDALEFYADYRNTIEIHIEDVCANKAMWHGKKESQAAKNMMSQRLGMCKQLQIEFERFISAAFPNIKIFKHKISKMWKKDKAQFKKVTGWTGRSNEDTRSSAYFGWLGCKV